MADAWSAHDARFMAMAIRLAERNVALTDTNPSVGALIVCNAGGQAVVAGRGVTAPGGRPHAEAVALAQARERAAGATAYVTLEPCAHYGRTPPCADALIEARIARVVFAASDPDPRVNGRGADRLRSAGVQVLAGVLAHEAERSLRGYLTRLRRKRPQVIMKIAVSADGMIGRRGAGQVRISSLIARAQTHLLRARSDAILVGSGTLREDDPALTCRLDGLRDRSPLRVVLDGSLATSADAILVRTARETPTVFATLDASSAKAAALVASGCRVVQCAAEGTSNRISLPAFLETLAAQGISTLLVEAGAAIATSFLRDDLVDDLIVIEGSETIGADGVRCPDLSDRLAAKFRPVARLRLGPDVWSEYERAD